MKKITTMLLLWLIAFIVGWYIGDGICILIINTDNIDIRECEIERKSIQKDEFEVYSSIKVRLDGNTTSEYSRFDNCKESQIDSFKVIHKNELDSALKVINKILNNKEK